ncbi:MAG: c-type cytochrome [Armatimonadetes bacterium]|nr:c-type cytochrome [Armatimonadota bacterium]
MRYVLVVASVVVLVLFGIMVAKSSYLTEWREYQQEYQSMLPTAPPEEGQVCELAQEFRIKQRQAVVPALKVMDRCVTCHLGMDNPLMDGAKQPFRKHPGDILTSHPVEKFGCTTCHRGQGVATTWRDARGVDVHWDDPLLPTKLIQSSCGACHDAEWLADNGAPLLAKGAALFEEHGCRSCHKLGGLGGTLGPALDNVGLKIPTEFSFTHVTGEHTAWNWLAEHFKDPQGVSPSSDMPPQDFTDEEMDAMLVFLLSQQANHIAPRQYLPDDYFVSRARETNSRPYSGEQLYNMLCQRCHGSGEKGRFDPFFAREMPAIRSQRFLETASEKFIRAQIGQGRPGTIMGAFGSTSSGLSEVEFDRLVAYVKGGVEDHWNELEPPPAGSAVKGKRLYTKHCEECHGKAGVGGSGNQLASRTFLKAATDGFIAESIRTGRPGTKMEPFALSAGGPLSEQEIGHLVAYIRTLSPGGKPK